jgi:hypothetical protein
MQRALHTTHQYDERARSATKDLPQAQRVHHQVVAALRHFATLRKRMVAASHAHQQLDPLVFDHQAVTPGAAQNHSD